MKLAVLALVVSACIPDEQIGTIEWEVGYSGTLVAAGPSGHLALVGLEMIEVLGPDGVRQWSSSLPGRSATVELDSAGGAVLISGEMLLRYDARGQLAWTHDLVDPMMPTRLGAIDAEDATWLLARGTTGGHWSRFSRDGDPIGEGDLPLRTTATGTIVALPASGIAFIDEGGGISAIDPAGPSWRLSPGREVVGFAVHDDGALTVIARDTVIQFDAQRVERWRRTGRTNSRITALTDGSVVTSRDDGFPNDASVHVLQRFAPDGTSTREVVVQSIASIVPAAAAASFRIVHTDTIESRRVF